MAPPWRRTSRPTGWNKPQGCCGKRTRASRRSPRPWGMTARAGLRPPLSRCSSFCQRNTGKQYNVLKRPLCRPRQEQKEPRLTRMDAPWSFLPRNSGGDPPEANHNAGPSYPGTGGHLPLAEGYCDTGL